MITKKGLSYILKMSRESPENLPKNWESEIDGFIENCLKHPIYNRHKHRVMQERLNDVKQAKDTKLIVKERLKEKFGGADEVSDMP